MCTQLELEFDLILQKKDAVSNAIIDWRMKWVPAICSFARSQTSKAIKAIVAQEKCGMSFNFLNGSLMSCAFECILFSCGFR